MFRWDEKSYSAILAQIISLNIQLSGNIPSTATTSKRTLALLEEHVLAHCAMTFCEAPHNFLLASINSYRAPDNEHTLQNVPGTP